MTPAELALLHWYQARETWRNHLGDCPICDHYYSDIQGICLHGAQLMQALSRCCDELDSAALSLMPWRHVNPSP